jgi:hypothetical protein
MPSYTSERSIGKLLRIITEDVGSGPTLAKTALYACTSHFGLGLSVLVEEKIKGCNGV